MDALPGLRGRDGAPDPVLRLVVDAPRAAIGGWPSSLREAVRICLRSRFQLAIYWGPQLILLYNDAERDVLGKLHPAMLGRPAAELLAESWDLLGPMLHGVLEGGTATWSVDESLRVNRRGIVEESFFTYSYSPIPDGDDVGGVLLVSFETTERVLAERRLRTLQELAAETARARDVEDACSRTVGVLAGNRSDLPFGLLFLADGAGRFRPCASTGCHLCRRPGPLAPARGGVRATGRARRGRGRVPPGRDGGPSQGGARPADRASGSWGGSRAAWSPG